MLWELRKNNYLLTLECPQEEGHVQGVRTKVNGHGSWNQPQVKGNISHALGHGRHNVSFINHAGTVFCLICPVINYLLEFWTVYFRRVIRKLWGEMCVPVCLCVGCGWAIADIPSLGILCRSSISKYYFLSLMIYYRSENTLNYVKIWVTGWQTGIFPYQIFCDV